MNTELTEPISYSLPLYNNLDKGDFIDMNNFIGKDVSIKFKGEINCIVTGKKINKTYGEGMSYDAFRKSPLAVESIIRPELSQAHLGVGLRDLAWEVKHDVQPHIVYLALTSNVKVGVTRKKNIPHRWIDQGAVEAVILAETPYRQAAGLLEVSLKKHFSDRTNWRKMLTNNYDESVNLLELVKETEMLISDEFKQYFPSSRKKNELHFPVVQYPEKVTSLKLDKTPVIEKKIAGIKGQYILFFDQTVINIRAHSGYRISIES